MSSSLDGLSVLYVDHDSERSGALALMLARRGFRVIRTATGEDALEQIPTLEPNVVVAAADLNGVGVLEVCRAAVAIPRPAVVILMAKCLDVSEATRAIGVGVCDFVRTPVDSEELLTRIAVHLRVARSRSQDLNGARGATPSAFGLLPAAATPAEGLILRRVRAPSTGAARARILLYQPEPQMGRALRIVLRLRGFAATLMHSAIGSAAAALTRAREAIVVDVGQAEGDALAFCLALRQCGYQGKVIATARVRSRRLEARAREAGIDAIVPFLEVVHYLEAEFPPRRSSGAPPASAEEDPRSASARGALEALTRDNGRCSSSSSRPTASSFHGKY